MEVIKLKDCFLFTKEDFQELVAFLNKERDGANLRFRVKDRLLFLFGLIIDLFKNSDKIRELKHTFKLMGMGLNPELDGFILILREWLEENEGNGNLLVVITVLRSNGGENLASLVEQFLLCYSLPSSGDGNINTVYTTSRDFLCTAPLPLWNSNPVGEALQNSVILEEVFRKLRPGDQKTFRVVNSTWRNETLSFWRRSSMLQLHVRNNPDGAKRNGISMASFVQQLSLEEKSPQQRKGNDKASNYQLTKHPFHRYEISYKPSRGDGAKVPFSCGAKEIEFWQLCGESIEDLVIDNALFGKSAENTIDKFCENIFLEICPKLKKLKISRSCRIEYFNVKDLRPDLIDKDNGDSDNERKVAVSNLHTLTVEVYIGANMFARILFLCPKLKTLILRTFWKTSNALLHPTANGECLKLEKLVVNCSGYTTGDEDRFGPLREYSEMLITKGINCLKHLVLERINLSDARNPPFTLYDALAKLGQKLKTLKLAFNINEPEHLIGDYKWFADLSPFVFPNLTELKIVCTIAHTWFMRTVHFDFGTLKGMPRLEKFEFWVKGADRVERGEGIGDWVFAGNRKTFLPKGLAADYFYSEESPILCANMKELTFIGWSLNEGDINLFSVWFPNLTHLKAAVELELCSLTLQSFPLLKMLDIETEEILSLGDLRTVKGMKKGLRICQTINGMYKFNRRQSLEMKEYNGRIYFVKQDSDE